MNEQELWRGLQDGARKALSTRDYRAADFSQRLQTSGVDAGQLAAAERAELKEAWIPGVEIFAREVHEQRQRGFFGELARRGQRPLGDGSFWPEQWAAARMFAGTAKGFHVHPPYVPEGENAAQWMQRLYGENGKGAPEYGREQWDMMFFLQGRLEMILHDVRAGLPRRTMRFFLAGDNHRGAGNVGVIIPPGVAHGLRVEGSEDAIMVYGTSTTFRPEFEGRIASEVETAELPDSWRRFLL